MRRKTLRNSLRQLLHGEEIESAQLEPAVRPEQVDLEGFVRLAKQLADRTGS